jgi:hypothetical protein
MWTAGHRTVSNSLDVTDVSGGLGGRRSEEQAHTKLDNVSDGAHNQEADTDSLRDLEELLLISCTKASQYNPSSREHRDI